MTALPTINKTRLDALRELARWQGPYWWRHASMVALECHGFVELFQHPEFTPPAWRITPAGTAYLAKMGAGR